MVPAPQTMTLRISVSPVCRGHFNVAVAGLGLGLDIHNVEVVRLVLRRQITPGSALRAEVKYTKKEVDLSR